jgi:hypothetical protein
LQIVKGAKKLLGSQELKLFGEGFLVEKDGKPQAKYLGNGNEG